MSTTPVAAPAPNVLENLDWALLLGKQGSLKHLADYITPVAHTLPWTNFYEETDLTRPFLSQFAVTEIAGPTGPIVAEDVIMGIFLLGPHTFYPLHKHKADEVYTVIAGQVHFMFDDHHEVTRGPGDNQYVPSGALHALQTGDEPFLALYTWIGDVREPVFFEINGEQVRMPLLPQYR